MDVKYINPFIDSVTQIFPQFGMTNVEKKGLKLKGKHIESKGVMIMLGLIGDVVGNVIYSLSEEDAKKIASTMMMGMPVEKLDELAQSAISELTNMLTATASIILSNVGVNINISTPTLVYGDFTATSSTDKTICITMGIGDINFDVNVALDKIL